MKTTCGKFTLDNGTLTGPAEYMRQRGNALADAICAGKDAVFNMTSHLSPSVEMAVLVRLQTDYAAWRGARQLMAALG
jgi:hypothetical protein